MIVQLFNVSLFNVSRFNGYIDTSSQNIIDCTFNNEFPISYYAVSDDGAFYGLFNNVFPLSIDSTSSKAINSIFNNELLLSLDATSSKQVDSIFNNVLPFDFEATTRLPVYSTFDNVFPVTLEASTGQVNIYQIDYNRDELVVSGTGAIGFNGTTVNQENSLGGYPCYSRITSFTPYRNNSTIENMNIVFISGANAEGELTVELIQNEDGYFIQYQDSDSTSFGEMVPVVYDEEIKVYSGNLNKFIIVEITEDLAIDKVETFSIRHTYNNVLSMNNFDLTGSTTQYRGIFIKNQHNQNIKNVKIWFDNGISKISSLYGLEYPINREIQVIPNIYTAPTDITWVNYDSTSAPALFDLNIADFVGVWIKNTYDSTSVSAFEPVNMYIEYEKGVDTIQKKLTGLTRGFNTYYDDKYKVHYNINNTIDASGTVSTIISEADITGVSGYTILDTSSISTLTDGDFIYYDVTKLNKFGLEGFKSLDKYMVYDFSSGLGSKPFGPESGSVLYNNTGSILVQGLYNPANEESKGIIDDIRATDWNFSAYVTDTSSYIVTNEVSNMNYDTGNEAEVFIKIIDDTTLLDQTPLTFELQSNRGSIISESTLTLTGEVCKQEANVPVINTLIGHNYGLNSKNTASYSEVLTIDSTGIVMTFGDGRASLYKDVELVFKYFYKGENSIFNTFYLPTDWSLLENQSFDSSSTITDHFTTYEYDSYSNNLYFLINLNRYMMIDFNLKQISIKGTFNDLNILPEVYSNKSIFPRYSSTVFQVWNISDQLLVPYFIVDTSGDINCLGEFNNNFDASEIEAIV